MSNTNRHVTFSGQKMELSLGKVLRLLTVLLCAVGSICAFVIWFVPSFYVTWMMIGLDMILINLLLVVSQFDEKRLLGYFNFLNLRAGTGATLMFMGCLWAGGDSLRIAMWVIYWLVGCMWIAAHFIPTFEVGPTILSNSGYDKAEHSQADGHSNMADTESYAPLE